MENKIINVDLQKMKYREKVLSIENSKKRKLRNNNITNNGMRVKEEALSLVKKALG